MESPAQPAFPTSPIPQPGSKGPVAFLLVALGFQAVGATIAIAVMITLAIISEGRPPSPARATELLRAVQMDPNYIVVLSGANTLSLVLAAWVAALINKPRVWRTLNVHRFSGLSLILVGTAGVFSLGGLAAALSLCFFSPGAWLETLNRASVELPAPQFTLFAFFGSVGAGVSEELLFRGYLQQRLVRRLGPVAGILITSAFFGLFHLYPGHMVSAFCIGLVLGSIAYAARSIWPSLIVHALNNALSFGLMRAGVSAVDGEASAAELLISAAVALPCLYFIVRAAMRRADEDETVRARLGNFVRHLGRAQLPPRAEVPVAVIVPAIVPA